MPAKRRRLRGQTEEPPCAQLTIGGGSPQLETTVTLWREGKLTDAEIRVGERVFSAHRLVLASHSDFMRALFEPRFRDSTGPVVLEDIPPALFTSVLEHMYTGECTIDKDAALDLARVASRLQATMLFNAVTDASHSKIRFAPT